MRKQLEDFLMDISEFYPIPSTKNYDKVISLSVEYLIQFCAGKEFDFKKALHLLFDKYKFKSFPDLGIIKDCLIANEIKKYKFCKDEGCLVTVQIPNKAIYAFEISAFGNNLEDIKKDIASKFGIPQVKIYPRGSVLIVDEVYTP